MRCSIRPRLAVLIVLTLALVGCLDSGSSSDNAAEPGRSDNRPVPEPGPGAGPPFEDDEVVPNRYQFANGCYRLQSGERYVAPSPAEESYYLTDNAEHAAGFTMRPTALGSYLLMSDFQREPGQVGRMELLGIRDPGNEFLDHGGTFVGEVSYLIAGLGDTVNLVSDPLLPLGDPLRGIGESIDDFGDRLAETQVRPELGMVDWANDLAVWQLNPADEDRFTLESRQTGLVLDPEEDRLTLSSPAMASERSRFRLVEAEGCEPYPEAELNLTVAEEGPANYLREVDRFRGIPGIDDDAVFGYVDTHSHISAYEMIGGRINYGDPFHRFGITAAMKDCKVNHGPYGSTGLLEQLTGVPGAHDTQGWPTFNDWPRHDSLQHHQSYYRWIERAHLGGMKLMVNHLVHNEILCTINPQKQNDCDPNETIKLQIQRMYEMQDYIDAQAGGPGEGFFRIVTSPAEAREVIGNGQLAVILGIEMSHPFGCREYQDVPQCTREQLVEDLDFFYELGVRNMFPVHKFDNAFGGHLPDLSSGIGVGPILAAGNLASTGHPIEYEECPDNFASHLDAFRGESGDNGREEYSGDEQDQNARMMSPLGIIEQLLFQMDYLGDRFPETPEELAEYDRREGTDHLCNRRGLTDLGHFLVQELMKRGILIETDHISRKAAARILKLTGEQDYPVINSHGNWGGTPILRDRIARQGGVTADFDNTRERWVDSLIRNGTRERPDEFKVGPFGGAGFATDVNGISSLAGNSGTAEDEARLYPFTSVDGRVTFDIQRTGDREFSLYSGRGVAHYGLYPDQIADMIQHSDRSQEEIDEAVNQLFTSAEAYLRMWERAEAAAR